MSIWPTEWPNKKPHACLSASYLCWNSTACTVCVSTLHASVWLPLLNCIASTVRAPFPDAPLCINPHSAIPGHIFNSLSSQCVCNNLIKTTRHISRVFIVCLSAAPIPQPCALMHQCLCNSLWSQAIECLRLQIQPCPAAIEPEMVEILNNLW